MIETNKEEEKNQEEKREKTPEKGGLGSEKGFYIDLRPKLVKLPPYENKTKINVRYPLIPPFAFAHIFWDDKNKELVYYLEEPVFTDAEDEVFRLVQKALEEMVNVNFVKADSFKFLIEYLEKSIQSILIELGIKLSDDSYKKLMYYIYRDSIGLNEIAPLMNDYYIEDIECNGLNYPLYVVHRKYENLRTNIKFTDSRRMINFVEKIAQKTGRYISYAKPMLDGTLPDGSRVNATYTKDITTRGPTFTVRKFTKNPWTPIHLIKMKTASAEIFAYIWLMIENKFNMMVIGETGSGKTTYLNSILSFIPQEARICSIEDTRELNILHDNWLPAVTRTGFGMPNIYGKQFGEITMFDLLKETFRQNPDYVVVGETRDREAYVMFQGMASGHPSYSTFHAASIEALVRRLGSPPIDLPPSLIESLDVICVVTHIKTPETNVRRMREVNEIQKVESMGSVTSNKMFEWDPLRDNFKSGKGSLILQKISERTGKPISALLNEMKRRTELLKIMVQQRIESFEEFTKIINEYQKDPQSVIKRFNLK